MWGLRIESAACFQQLLVVGSEQADTPTLVWLQHQCRAARMCLPEAQVAHGVSVL